MCGKVSDKSWASLFCFSLVKSEATWLHPEDVRYEAEKYFFWIDVDRPSKWNMEMKLFAHFLHFGANLQLQFSSPLNTDFFWPGFSYPEVTEMVSGIRKLIIYLWFGNFGHLMIYCWSLGFEWCEILWAYDCMETGSDVSVWVHGDVKSCERMSALRHEVMWTC